MGEAPHGQKGPSQADLVKANSPPQSLSPAVAPILVPALSATKPGAAPVAVMAGSGPPAIPATAGNVSVADTVGNGQVVPIYPVLAIDLARSTTAQPSPTDSLPDSDSTSPSHRTLHSVHPSSIHASLPAPLSPSTMSAISRSLPAPLPPVKGGARPEPSPRSALTTAVPDMNGSQLLASERRVGSLRHSLCPTAQPAARLEARRSLRCPAGSRRSVHCWPSLCHH